jgi:peptide chain release factor subunit 1
MTTGFEHVPPAPAPATEGRPTPLVTAGLLARLDGFRGGDVPVVSAYVGIPRGVAGPPAQRAALSRVTSLLHELRSLSENGELDRASRLSVRGDIERIEVAAGEMQWSPGAVAMFSCSARDLFETVALPRTVRDRVVVDPAPWTRPMHAVLDGYHRAAVVVLDRRRARLWEMFRGESREEASFEVEVVRKPNFGGWYGLEEYRVSDRADEIARRHFVRVADTLRALFRDRTYEVLVLGGHQDELTTFQEFLPKALRSRVVGTFTAEPSTVSEASVRASTAEIVAAYQRDNERRTVDDVLGRAAAGGLARSGLPSCLWAGSVSAVQLLLVDDEAVAAGRGCDSCGWLGLDGGTCPVCGVATREHTDVVDELAQRVIDEGGSVAHIAAETPLREALVAAALRFQPPPEPGT